MTIPTPKNRVFEVHVREELGKTYQVITETETEAYRLVNVMYECGDDDFALGADDFCDVNIEVIGVDGYIYKHKPFYHHDGENLVKIEWKEAQCLLHHGEE